LDEDVGEVAESSTLTGGIDEQVIEQQRKVPLSVHESSGMHLAYLVVASCIVLDVHLHVFVVWSVAQGYPARPEDWLREEPPAAAALGHHVAEEMRESLLPYHLALSGFI